MPEEIYIQLRRHMDSMPVGFPKTRTGVEYRILERFFTPEEASLALHLDYKYRSPDEIAERPVTGMDVATMLEEMAKKGAIMKKYREGKPVFALGPYVVGIYEMQLKNLSPGLLRDSNEFFYKGYGLEYLTTPLPQMRVIPVEKSIPVEHQVATYDEIRTLVREAGDRIAIGECICKKAKDLRRDACKVTDRREVCMALRDFADVMIERDWGRRIDAEEAFRLLDEAEKDGLVLQPANEQQPQFVCACCSCCCGILSLVKAMKKPADFLASNYRAVVDAGSCNACGLCVKRCQMEAIRLNGKASIDPARCIGCGLCVTSCKPGALALEEKNRKTVPPLTEEDLFEHLARHKRTRLGKLYRGVRGLLGV